MPKSKRRKKASAHEIARRKLQSQGDKTITKILIDGDGKPIKATYMPSVKGWRID